MTKKELRKKAEEILGGARKDPVLLPGWTMKGYREFWQAKRIGICQLLEMDTCVRCVEFPFPWERG